MPASTGLPFDLLVFDTGIDGPHLLISAGVHGDEFEPIVALLQLAELFQGATENPALKAGKLTLIPCVNENAFQLGHRCASDGLDLARTCPGRADGSLTEQAAHSLSQCIRAADFYIDLHTGGTEFDIFPLTGYMLHPDRHVLCQQRRMAHSFGLPLVWGTTPNLDGRSLSVARDAGVPAIYCEFGGAARCSVSGVDAYVSGCLNVLADLEMISPRTSPEPARYVVEDLREDSGHLQICNPSPIDGLFLPHVALGNMIEKGELLGTVSALNGNGHREIRSDSAGLVILLRTFPRVHAGKSVGVVIEMPKP
ncbi:MAG: succinylglutamate desuccinylase/aspartoacylase family protein [Planctomycetaceae bacterium]|nr:succinylglutamate desuccinylase/aspartoacylase family protein [Planctomycetaceae bacterium]